MLESITTTPLPTIEAYFTTDSRFDKLYPLPIRQLGTRHWTNLAVAEIAAKYLAEKPGSSILDIGSGVGKFCLAAAYYQPNAVFYGIEQRQALVTHATAAKQTLQLKNAHFIHGNFTDLDFKQYNHFYFYNSFYENIAGESHIDESITYSTEIFEQYNWLLHQQLAKRPSGTRIATYHSTENEIPNTYHVMGSEMDDLVKFWMKE